MGEGDTPFEFFLGSYPDTEKIKETPNFHLKIHKHIYKNPMLNLQEDLDKLLFPDRSIYYDKFEVLRNLKTKAFMAGKGCPHRCTYCFNSRMSDIYKGMGKYVRFRSPENIVEEINIVRQKYPLEYISFNDDTFTSNKKWLFSFLELYKRKVNLPFLSTCRLENLDDQTVKKMKEAGVDRLNFGVEHGNEAYRMKMLGKNITNATIVDKCKILKKYNIRFHVGNMVMLPGETLNMAYETLRLNQQIKPNFAYMSVWQPYPGSKLRQMAVEDGYIEKGTQMTDLTGHATWSRSDMIVLKSVLKNKKANQMLNLRCFFPFLIKYPFLSLLIKPLLLIPHNKYFEFVQAYMYTKIKVKYAANANEKKNYYIQLLRRILPKIIQRQIEKKMEFQTLI